MQLPALLFKGSMEFTMTSTAQRLLEATSSSPAPLLAEELDSETFESN